MNWKKFFGIAALIFILFFIVTSPTQAADITHNLWDGLVNIAHGLSTFITSL